MHHYMGLSVNNYSQSFKGNLEAYIKTYNERILNLVNLVKRINEFNLIMNMPYDLGKRKKPDEHNCVVKSVQTDFP